MFKKYRNKNKKGFSLVELIVVIGIMAILVAVLAPSLLQYTEKSRAQRDDSAMDEVVNAVQLAMADQKCYDEMLRYSCTNNYVTYTDSSGNYGQKVNDAEYWAPDGSGKATTITFNPIPGSNGKTYYSLDSAIINDMTYGNGSMGSGGNRVMTGALIENNQCYLKNACLNDNTPTGYLYNRVRQVIGDDVFVASATYKNSSYTVFIRFNQKDGVTVADVNGSFNGTNLYKAAPSSNGSGTSSYDNAGNPVSKPGHQAGLNSTPVFNASDLAGSGSLGGSLDYKSESGGSGGGGTTPPSDTTVPTITLSQTLSDDSANPTPADSATFKLSGTVTDDSGIASLKVNGDSVTVNVDNTWSHTLTLTQNVVTEVKVVATDGGGNTAEKSGYVLYAVPIYSANFADNTWEQIIEACQNNDVPETWAVGKTKPMTINGAKYNVMIIGKSHDTYTDGGTAPLTFQLVECYGTKAKMESTSTNKNGWSGSQMRTTTLPGILAGIDNNIVNAMQPVQKQTLKGDKSGLEPTSDKVFLLSEYELFGTTDYSNGFKEGSAQYDYYANGGLLYKTLNGSSCVWWLRSPRYGYTHHFSGVLSMGYLASYDANRSYGVAFGFCF